jgi:hypothetical protein
VTLLKSKICDMHPPTVATTQHQHWMLTFMFQSHLATGSIYTPNSNQYAPAVICSRTLRNTKLNRFSDTYCTAVMQGGYEGFDSSFIKSMGRFFSQADSLSLLWDSLSNPARDDVRCHVTSLCKDPSCSP